SDQYITEVATAYGVNLIDSFACHAPNATTEQCRFAIVLGRVVDDGTEANGTPTPVAGVASTDFTIKGDGSDTWYQKGPYFLDATGAPSASNTATQRVLDAATQQYRGGLFVSFV